MAMTMSMTSCSLMPLLIGTTAACAQHEEKLTKFINLTYTVGEKGSRPGCDRFKLTTGLFKNEPDGGILFTNTFENEYSMEYQADEDLEEYSKNRIYFESYTENPEDPKFTLGRHWISLHKGHNFSFGHPQDEWYLTAENVELSDAVKKSNKRFFKKCDKVGNKFTVLLNGSGLAWIMRGIEEREIDFNYNITAMKDDTCGGAIAFMPITDEDWKYGRLSKADIARLHRRWGQRWRNLKRRGIASLAKRTRGIVPRLQKVEETYERYHLAQGVSADKFEVGADTGPEEAHVPAAGQA